MIKFYYNLAPNPTKVALALEEMGLQYELVPVDTRKAEQHTPAFLAVNPNAYRARIEHFTDLVVKELPPGRAAPKDGGGHPQDKLPAAERRLLEKVSGSYKVFLDAGGREWTDVRRLAAGGAGLGTETGGAVVRVPPAGPARDPDPGGGR